MIYFDWMEPGGNLELGGSSIDIHSAGATNTAGDGARRDGSDARSWCARGTARGTGGWGYRGRWGSWGHCRRREKSREKDMTKQMRNYETCMKLRKSEEKCKIQWKQDAKICKVLGKTPATGSPTGNFKALVLPNPWNQMVNQAELHCDIWQTMSTGAPGAPGAPEGIEAHTNEVNEAPERPLEVEPEARFQAAEKEFLWGLFEVFLFGHVEVSKQYVMPLCLVMQTIASHVKPLQAMEADNEEGKQELDLPKFGTRVECPEQTQRSMLSKISKRFLTGDSRITPFILNFILHINFWAATLWNPCDEAEPRGGLAVFNAPTSQKFHCFFSKSLRFSDQLITSPRVDLTGQLAEAQRLDQEARGRYKTKDEKWRWEMGNCMDKQW